MDKLSIGIIGGGASGIMAACTSAFSGNVKVTLFEKNTRIGKKLLSTGNGRCNLSNLSTRTGKYHSDNPDFQDSVFSQFDVRNTLDFFESIGLIVTAEEDGKVYPFTDQANSVLDVLRFYLTALKVDIKTECEVSAVFRKKDQYIVQTKLESFRFDRIIIACGGEACSALGGTRSGYQLLEGLGHHIHKTYPALVKLQTSDKSIIPLKGIRTIAAVSVFSREKLLAQSKGEIQFSDMFLSGPAIFEVSRAASVSSKPVNLILDLMPDLSLSELTHKLLERQSKMPELTIDSFLSGFLRPRLGLLIMKKSGACLNLPISTLSKSQIIEISQLIKKVSFDIVGTAGFENAQVTVGGADTKEFDPKTLESRLNKGLFSCGEVLDIDGDCGGWNLQWAWSSGYVAGKNAVK